MKKKDEKIDKKGQPQLNPKVNCTSGYVSTTSAHNGVMAASDCDICGLPLWATTPSELSCTCWAHRNNYTTVADATNTQILEEIKNLKEMIKQLVTEVSNKNIERAVNDIKFIMRKNAETK